MTVSASTNVPLELVQLALVVVKDVGVEVRGVAPTVADPPGGVGENRPESMLKNTAAPKTGCNEVSSDCTHRVTMVPAVVSEPGCAIGSGLIAIDE